MYNRTCDLTLSQAKGCDHDRRRSPVGPIPLRAAAVGSFVVPSLKNCGAEEAKTDLTNHRFCRVEALAAGEPLCATAPERDAVVLIPKDKRSWATVDPPSVVQAFRSSSDLAVALTGVRRPLVAFYHPDLQNSVLVSFSGSRTVQQFANDGAEEDVLSALIVAVCTDGQSDPCCAKFGLPVFKSLLKFSEVIALQTSHLGGCRFAATALFLPSGHCYGRIEQNSVTAAVIAESAGRIDPSTFRGTIYGSELDCWAVWAWQQEFGYVPALQDLNYTREGSGVRISGPQAESIFLTERIASYPLRSGCTHLDINRRIDRASYERRC